MLIGSATMVTYRSDRARLPMKMHSIEFIFFDLQRATRMSRFPNAPTSEARIRATNRQDPTPGDSAMNSNRLKMDDVVSSFSILSFSFLLKSIFEVNGVQGISIVNVNIHTCFY